MLTMERDRGSDAKRRARGVRRFEANVEGMEDRRLLSGSGATIFLSGTTVEVYGTNGGDTSVVAIKNDSVDVKVSNAQGSDDILFPASQVTTIQYFGGSGDDTFTNATSLTGFLYGGSGNNTLTGGSGRDYLIATGTGNNVLNAGSGFEFLASYGTGTNTLNAGSGFTQAFAFSGINHFQGGAGSAIFSTYGGQNVVDGGEGYVTVYSFVSTDVIHPNDRMTVWQIGY